LRTVDDFAGGQPCLLEDILDDKTHLYILISRLQVQPGQHRQTVVGQQPLGGCTDTDVIHLAGKYREHAIAGIQFDLDDSASL